ncbi:hypothetical protein [Acinetobacter stercoris]|uniref:Uncharacterized protein n=1 Tax=Acinetobacter stercoris TaxID=2126983 RepID=A0A2U3N4U1_9GAMM|nr:MULTISPECIES: hypothetical protein [Acinetobacter]SPL72589.1 hypothetical protein KPC_3767 [Acinetobacter stercoris]
MFKMIDVLDQTLVQNFRYSLSTPSKQFDELLNQGILNASDSMLTEAISYFFSNNDILDIAEALDIDVNHIYDLQRGIKLKTQENLADTAKIVTLCLALETNSLDEVDIADSLQDYPM